ncbi:radical SAM protein [Streptomyces sp. NBC_00257]|uniref:radical SAM protein n=1 Tax=unclassified Streptomyces TaxID=2593676 RepID=UPI0022529968|nr:MULTISPECIES: radical SAM protein [unclassified Streptomyces]WTB59225.1 radical SAM protein [Streptomyces sp. NBC_00826]WTH87902.1 radical SAM protein [Streptomyces sp. NBC_00825]WTH96629.1 radical SAM protein [Streptomyces sp. NBC_00822]MCX4870106.1 radical SAM protein [Streptomyces sp. NBC_00906]MCX4901269.1 radical SAM protein [Streptomyces sp. NBC_00892]
MSEAVGIAVAASDRLLKPGACQALADAGCGALQLGLVSLAPDTLRQEAKPWNHPRNYGRIPENLSNAGVQVHVFIIVGVPEEPINQSLRRLSFLQG